MMQCILCFIENRNNIWPHEGEFQLMFNLFIYLCLPFQLGKCGFLKRVEHLRCRESSLSIRSVLQVQKGRKEKKDKAQWGYVYLGSCRSFGKWWCGKGVGWGDWTSNRSCQCLMPGAARPNLANCSSWKWLRIAQKRRRNKKKEKWNSDNIWGNR